MTYATHVGSLGVLMNAMVVQVIDRVPWWLALLGVGFALLGLVGAFATRLEALPPQGHASQD